MATPQLARTPLTESAPASSLSKPLSPVISAVGLGIGSIAMPGGASSRASPVHNFDALPIATATDPDMPVSFYGGNFGMRVWGGFGRCFRVETADEDDTAQALDSYLPSNGINLSLRAMRGVMEAQCR